MFFLKGRKFWVSLRLSENLEQTERGRVASVSRYKALR